MNFVNLIRNEIDRKNYFNIYIYYIKIIFIFLLCSVYISTNLTSAKISEGFSDYLDFRVNNLCNYV